MFLVHLFIDFAGIKYCLLSLPLGVVGWQRRVIVALCVSVDA